MVDRVRRVAVCNESADIVRSLDELHLPGCTDVQLRPKHLAAQIDQLNAKVGATVCIFIEGYLLVCVDYYIIFDRA